MSKEYKNKTWIEFLKWKFANFPTIQDARDWKSRLGGNPLTPEEWTSFANCIDEKHAFAMNKMRQMTLFDWYVDRWALWLTSWSRHEHNNTMYENYFMETE
jgi:hypothetical protein